MKLSAMPSCHSGLPIRLRQRVRHRSDCRCAATRTKLAAACGAWTVCRATFGHRIYRATPREPPQLAVPHPAGGSARAVCGMLCSPLSTTTSTRRGHARTACAGIRCRCRRRQRISSMACSRWRAMAVRRRRSGVGIHVYAANRSMQGRFFYDADGELLIVPQQGRLRIATELGVHRRSSRRKSR